MIKKLLFIFLFVATAAAQTSPPYVRSSLTADYRARLRTATVANHQKCTVSGINAFNDSTPEIWYYDDASMATDNNTTVLKPDELTSMEPGRWLFLYKAPTGDIPIPTINFSPGRTTNTAFQNTGTRPMLGVYSITASVTNPLLAGSSTVQVYGEISANGTTGWTTPTQNGNASTVGVAVAVAITNGQTANLVFPIPVGQYGRIRVVTTGTGSASIVQQWEMTL